MVKTTESEITHKSNMLDPLNSTTEMVRKSFIEASIKFDNCHASAKLKVKSFISGNLTKFRVQDYFGIRMLPCENMENRNTNASTSHITQF